MAWAWRISGLDQADTPLEWCSDKVSDLDKIVKNVTLAKTTVVSPWWGIRREGTYSGPGDEELFSAMKPVEIGCAELVEDLKLLADALDTLHTEGAEQKRKLASLRSEAARLYEETWGHDPESPFYEGPQVESDFSGWDYKEVIDGTLTRWEFRSEYQEFVEKNADLCARINHTVNGYDDVVDECVRTINGIGWEPWWNPSGLTPQGLSQMAPQIGAGVAAQAETAMAAQYVQQVLTDMAMSSDQAATIQAWFDGHMSDPAWMNQFVTQLGGSTVAFLLGMAGLRVMGGDDPDGVWASLAGSVRAGISVASQEWDHPTADNFAWDMLDPTVTVSGLSIVGFLFADPANAAMGSEFTVAMITNIAASETELGLNYADWVLVPTGVALAGTTTVTDPMGYLLSTLAVYPVDSLVFFNNPSNGGIVQWLLEGRSYLDGFTGVTDALLASQSVDDMCVAGLGGQSSDYAEAMVVSQTSVWLGHNPNLPSMSDQAKDNVFDILSPYQQEFIQAVSVGSPGVFPIEIDGLPSEIDPVTGMTENLPKLDKDGVAALVGRSSDTDEGKQRWLDHALQIAAVEMDTAVNSSTDSAVQADNIRDVELQYHESVGFVWGASAATAVMDGRNKYVDELQTLATVEQGVGSLASYIGGEIGESAGDLLGPGGAVVGDLVGGWVAERAVDHQFDKVENQVTAAEHTAEMGVITTSQSLVNDTITNWNSYYASMGYPVIDTRDRRDQVTYQDVRDALQDGYIEGGQGIVQGEDVDKWLPGE